MSSTKLNTRLVSVTEQPQPSAAIYPLDAKLVAPSSVEYDEKVFHDDNEGVAHNHQNSCDCQSQSQSHTPSSDHRHCHNGRLRRFLVPALLALVFLAGLFTFSCMSGHSVAGWGADSLFSRAVTDGTTGNGTQGSFIHNKLYLIVVFVGLLVVVILAVMLSAWCCKGAFENPLCCPCYLCACCGGLACLECIGCGLCAEGIDQM
ncbi:hypothetical protein GALMADRAFT_789508 [Galerina marginata CBS 339.88]|uniref:Transmembrane protein n=1 Tax=Galerina marginata (strain CBS 339.88) TaxID=685588 RepID=A0A067SV33_GALM3|nr:hypothetical protein GALMADRAFT_789508 [Galerina marginata CBS 339.88]